MGDNKKLIERLRGILFYAHNAHVCSEAADALEAADARIPMLEFSVSEIARVKDAEITRLRARVAELAERFGTAVHVEKSEEAKLAAAYRFWLKTVGAKIDTHNDRSLSHSAFCCGWDAARISSPQPAADAVKKAKRYEWLCNHLHDTDVLTDLYKHAGDVPTPDQLSAAIDAAMESSK